MSEFFIACHTNTRRSLNFFIAKINYREYGYYFSWERSKIETKLTEIQERFLLTSIPTIIRSAARASRLLHAPPRRLWIAKSRAARLAALRSRLGLFFRICDVESLGVGVWWLRWREDSKPESMLRARRRDVNLKPNRRLDRKSSRGMLYENEELRLRTININAEVERGNSLSQTNRSVVSKIIFPPLSLTSW